MIANTLEHFMKDQASRSTPFPVYSPGASGAELRKHHLLVLEAISRGVCVLAMHGRAEVLIAPLRVQYAPLGVIMTGKLLERDGVPVKGDLVTVDIATLSEVVVTHRKFTAEKRA